jgi:hypothetical protein
MRILQIGMLTTIVLLTAAYGAQQIPGDAPLQIPSPHYATMTESIVIDAPVVKVWRTASICRVMAVPGVCDPL